MVKEFEWNLSFINRSSPSNSSNSMGCLYRRSDIEAFYSSYVIVTISLNVICSILTTVLNLLVVITVWKNSQLHNPSKVLLTNLALTDFGVGFLVQPILVVGHFGAISGNVRLYCIASLASITMASVLGTVSLITLTAISIDRLLALVLSSRYQTVVTVRRTVKIVVVLWIISIVSSSPLFLHPRSFIYCMILLLVPCLTATTCAYAKFLHLIHRHRSRVETNIRFRLTGQVIHVRSHAQHSQASQLTQVNQGATEATTIAKYRSSTRTVIYLMLLMIICYAPYLILNVLMAVDRRSDDHFRTAFHITLTVFLLNSLANPVFCCCRMRCIRKATLSLFSKLRQMIFGSLNV